jgi:hypothetical protein
MTTHRGDETPILRREQKQVGRWLWPVDEIGAEDIWLKQREQAGQLKKVAQPECPRIGGDAEGDFELGKRLPDTGGRLHLRAKGLVDTPHALFAEVGWKTLSEGSFEVLPHVIGRSTGKLAHQFLGRDRVAKQRKEFGIDAALHELAVDQNTVAIENHQIGMPEWTGAHIGSPV